MFDSYIYDKVADRHSFNIENVDLGIINSIRRVILSEIPVVAFYGEEHPTVDILYNNTPLHNEYMIHRIGLIPLNIKENITENYEDNDPIILSVSEKDEVSIADVGKLIAKEFDYEKHIVFDTNFSDGQFKKTTNNGKLLGLIQDFSFTPLEKGIKESVQWFQENVDLCRK